MHRETISPGKRTQIIPWKIKTRMENNIGDVRKTVLIKDSGSATIQKIMGSGPVPHHEAEEVLIHQVRETATRI